MSEQMNVDDANVAESVLQYMRDEVENTSNGSGESSNNGAASASNDDHSHSQSNEHAAAAAADVAFAALKAVGASDHTHDNGDYLQEAASEDIGYSKKDSKSKSSSSSLSSSKKKSGEGKSHGKRSKDSGNGSGSSSSSSHKKRKTSSDEKKSKKKNLVTSAELEEAEEAKKRAAVAAFLASTDGDMLTHRVSKNDDNGGSSVAGVDPELAGLDDEVDANEAIHQYLKSVDESRPEYVKSKKDKKSHKKGRHEAEEETEDHEDNDVTSNLQKYLIDNPEENGDKKLKHDQGEEENNEDHEESVQNGEDDSGAITTTTTANGSIVSIAPAAGETKKSRRKSTRGTTDEQEQQQEQQQDGKKAKKNTAKKTETKPKAIVKKKSVSHHTKSKAFKQEEEEIIDNFITAHCERLGLTREDFCKRIWSNAGQKDNFWKSLCELFPERSRSSLYKHVRRRYHIFEQRGKWTAEEDANLRQICLEKEGQWSLVGQMLGRMPEDCRDRWRNYLKCGDNKNTAKWTPEEEQNLIVIVNRVVANGYHYYLAKEAFIRKKDFLVQSALLGKVSEKEARDAETAFTKLTEREKEQDHHIDSIRSTNLKEVINWTLISEVMNGTRSRIQIRYKWKNSLKKMVKKWFEKSNKLDFVKFVKTIKQQLDDGYENEDLLNWFKIYDNFCHDGKDSINEEESKLEIKFAPSSSDSENEKNGSAIIVVESSLLNKEKKDEAKSEEDKEDVGKNVEETREKLIHHPNAAVLKGIYEEFKSKLPVETNATDMHEIVSAMETFVDEW
ncbi:hypothetical protein ACO0QE_000764 [Hanseniaspora vineae]